MRIETGTRISLSVSVAVAVIAGCVLSLTFIELHGDAQMLSDAAYARLVDREQRAVALGILSTAALLGLLLLHIALVRHAVLRPLARLRQGAEIVGAGHFDHRIDMRTCDEIGDLAGTFDRMTEHLQETHGLLQREIAGHQRTEDALRDAVARLEAHDRVRSEFVSNVSHELKTPLTSMSYGIDNMLKGVTGPLNAPTEVYLRMLRENVARLRRTVTDILDLSRIEAGVLAMHCVTVPLPRLVLRALDAVRLQAEMKHQDMSFGGGPDAAFVTCDPDKIQRVAINVIQNAIKYTPEHGRIEIGIRVDVAAGSVSLDVTDNGPGIPEEHLEHVTRRYYRIGEHISGTGLGLTLCKEIMDRHGGALRLQSPPPGRHTGVTASVSLPLAPAPRVLAADRDTDDLARLASQLAAHGYRFLGHPDGGDALSLVRDKQPDILVVDLMPDGLAGVELIASVRADPTLSGLSIVAVAPAQPNRVKQELMDGFRIPALTRPWREDELLNAIEEAVIGKDALYT